MPQIWTCGLLFLLSSSVGICHYLDYSYHEGIFSNRVEDGQLVIPRKVNHLGEHISHDLTHYHDDPPRGIAFNATHLHYSLELNNETLHIELEPSHESFIAPELIIERRRRDLRSRKKHKHERKNGTACHYQGHVKGHHRSKVALSACNGLAGFMATKDGFYWLEPSKKHKYNTDMGHPHVVFQGQNDVISATKQPKKPQGGGGKNSKKKHQHWRKKRRVSTCGTKEPKQSSETKIEWQKQGKVIVQGGRKTRPRRRNHQNGNKNKKSRAKRSVSTPHHVEALVVADPSMVSFHKDSDVKTYLLTIMNMVSSLYKDPSIGNRVHIVVVKIIVFEEEDPEDDEELSVSHQAETTLSNFCRWQRSFNPKDDRDPEHHDVAILVTRKDICSHNGCMTLGVANVGGMCRPERSCSVNEDNGITLAHTITHELGHNFGMYHDTEKTGCGYRLELQALKTRFVMTPSFEADTTHVSWSNCSRRDITHFLDQGFGTCLDDSPAEDIEKEYTYPELPPGIMYNAELQCRLQFNVSDETIPIRVCSRMDEICSQLWCEIEDNCVTQLKAAAPGTTCGRHKWCQGQKCVPMEDLPGPVDGGWGNWTDWSECSRECGAGVSTQFRECDNPPPANGGIFCVGERTRYRTCNVEPCPNSEPSFRAVQCSRYDNETFRGKNYTWLPYFDTHEPCKLYCTDTDDTVIVPWGVAAADGTPCNIGTNDMCISGICKKVGCDWVVDSNTTEDQCGVCGGDSETCHVVKGEFNKKLNITEGYYPIITIPTGSRNIHIEEIGPSKNFLSIGKADSNVFYLNGERLIYLSGEYEIAGATGLYERNNEKDKEMLKIPGPIKEDIILYVLMKGKHKNVGLKYEYTLSSNSTIEPVYAWKLGDWTACSATCGGGLQHRFPICYQEHKGIVDENLCWSNAQNSPPDQKKQVCNEVICPSPHWWLGPWQLCPVTCRKRGDPDPVKKRSIMCVDQNDVALPDSSCDETERPPHTKLCNMVLPYCSESAEEKDPIMPKSRVVDKGILNNIIH